MIQTIGMVGLGLMGSVMSTNILKAGFTLVGYDIKPDLINALESKGGKGAISCKEVAQLADVVITSLPSESSLTHVVSGNEGLLDSNKKGLVVIETSTLPLEAKKQAKKSLGAAGMVLLDCPLSGTAAQAAVKDLVVYASGQKKNYDACIPVFESFARSHYYLGEFGMGSKMKFIANLLVAIHNVSAAEAFVLGMKAGLDPEMIYKVIRDGAGSSRMFEVRGPLMVSEKYYNVTMKVDVFQKDIEIITSFAKELNVPTPLLSAASQIYTMAMATGHAKQDTASVCEVLQKMAGFRKR